MSFSNPVTRHDECSDFGKSDFTDLDKTVLNEGSWADPRFNTEPKPAEVFEVLGKCATEDLGGKKVVGTDESSVVESVFKPVSPHEFLESTTVLDAEGQHFGKIDDSICDSLENSEVAKALEEDFVLTSPFKSRRRTGVFGETASSSIEAPQYTEQLDIDTPLQGSCGFDDPDEGAWQHDGLAFDEGPEDQSADNQLDFQGCLPPSWDEFFEPVNPRAVHRLRTKTPAHLTNYSNTALVTKFDYKVKKSQIKVQKAAFRLAQRTAKQTAIRLLAAQPELVQVGQAEQVGAPPMVFAASATPHSSHDIQSLASNCNIIYCRACSGWSLRIKLKSLKEPCEGLKNGNRSRLALLKAGVAPYPGAKMPAHLSRVHCRGKQR